jgi:hypothetical protein
MSRRYLVRRAVSRQGVPGSGTAKAARCFEGRVHCSISAADPGRPRPRSGVAFRPIQDLLKDLPRLGSQDASHRINGDGFGDLVIGANDDAPDPGHILLSESHVGPLKSEENRRVRLATALKTSASGKYVVAVLDATNAVVEVNEVNNVVVFGPIE